MNNFLELHGVSISGTIETFDRVIFKGHLNGFFPSGAVSGGGGNIPGLSAPRAYRLRGAAPNSDLQHQAGHSRPSLNGPAHVACGGL